MNNQLLLEHRLRMQLIAGVINESQYSTLLEEGIIDKLKQAAVSAIVKGISKVLSEEGKENLESFMMETFGTLTPDLTKDNAEKLTKALNIKTVPEAQWVQGFKPGESILVKILEGLSKVAMVNLLMFSTPLLYVLRHVGIPLTQDSRGDYLISFGIGVLILKILSRVMSLLGYSGGGTGPVRWSKQQDSREVLKTMIGKN